MKIDFSKILLYCYGFLLFFTPLIVFHKTSELFEFNKMLFIYLITAVILFIWIIKMICYKKIIIKKTFLDIPICLFFISQVLSTVFSIDQHTSFFGYYGRFNGGLLSLIAYIILYYAFISNLTKDAVLSLLKVSLVSSLLVVIVGLPGKFGYDLLCLVFTGIPANNCWTDQFQPAVRMFATLGQPNWLGAYLGAHLFIGLYFVLAHRKDRRIEMLFYTLYILLNFTAILFTRSRSTFFAVSTAMAIFWVFVLRHNQIRKELGKKLALLSGLLLITVIIFKTGIPKIDRYFRWRTDNITSSQNVNQQINITDSFDIRKTVWRGALKLGLRYPLFGTGVETFAYAYYFTRPIEHNLTSEWDFVYNKAHNEYLNYFATTGFFGLGSYLSLIVVFISWMVKKLKVKSQKSKVIVKNSKLSMVKILDLDFLFYLSLFTSWVTILITNFFGFSTTMVNLFFFLIPAFVLALDQSASDDKKFILDSKQKIFAWTSLLGFVGIFMLLLAYFTADLYYARAEELSRADRYDQAAQILTTALSVHYEHVYEDKLSSYLAAASYLASIQKSDETVGKMMRLSEYYSDRALKKSSYNILYWKTRAKNQFLFYQTTFSQKYFDETLVALKKASSLAPTDPQIFYLKTLFYSYASDSEKDKDRQIVYQKAAIAAADRAIELKNNFRDAYFVKGQLLKKYGKNDEAKKTFEYILQNINSGDKEAKKEIN